VQTTGGSHPLIVSESTLNKSAQKFHNATECALHYTAVSRSHQLGQLFLAEKNTPSNFHDKLGYYPSLIAQHGTKTI
jgi:hypothetical protein